MGEQTLSQALGQYHDQFAQELRGLSRLVERRYFAHILLCRLLLVYDLQVAGFLGGGDRWYLHNQLGQPLQNSSRSFFQTFWQPLCHQGLSLPEAERPQAVQARAGAIPYLGSRLFAALPLEQRHSQLDLPNEPIEQFLGWLAEQVWERHWHREPESPIDDAGITRATLAAAWELLLAEPVGKAAVVTPADLTTIRQETLDSFILQAIATPATAKETSLSERLQRLNDDTCRLLIRDTLPNLSILDPACGSGRLLVMALERLQQIYQACWDYAQTSSSPVLQAWVRSLQSRPYPPLWTLTQQILTQNLYGVDLQPEAIAITQTQLWLRLLSTADSDKPLPLLPDLDFNLVTGNSLIGFIGVDEESYDQIVSKRSKSASKSAADQETVLQGNLLQPLAAASYRDTLAEKQIRIEHYRAQTQAMGLEGGMPEYVQREFLRDRIEAVNTATQQKLNDLLLETLSRQLGILVKEPQLSGRARKRLLTLADIEALQPLHWGFVFNKILAQGGFDLIFTHAPRGMLRPRVEEFYRLHEECFEQLAIPLSALRRSRQQVLQQHPELAARWSIYAGHIACLRDYVRRSADYQAAEGTTTQRSVPVKSLFSQRCAALIKARSPRPLID